MFIHDGVDSTAISFPHWPKAWLTTEIPTRKPSDGGCSQGVVEKNQPFQSDMTLLDSFGIETDRWNGTTGTIVRSED